MKFNAIENAITNVHLGHLGLKPSDVYYNDAGECVLKKGIIVESEGTYLDPHDPASYEDDDYDYYVND